jgi:hypothetical protein
MREFDVVAIGCWSLIVWFQSCGLLVSGDLQEWDLTLLSLLASLSSRLDRRRIGFVLWKMHCTARARYDVVGCLVLEVVGICCTRSG